MIEVRAPFDGAPVGAVATANADAVERALATAHALYRNRRQWLPKQRRIAILHRAAELASERREALARQAAHEGGKPYRDSLVEADRGIDGIRSCVEVLRTEGGHVIPMDLNATSAARVAFTQYEPIGAVVGASAFNHPFNLVVHQCRRGPQGGVRPGGLRLRLRRPRRGGHAGQRLAVLVPGGRVHAQPGHRDALLAPSRRHRSDGQREHAVPRRLDAVRRRAGVGPRRRRHPVHDARDADREDDGLANRMGNPNPATFQMGTVGLATGPM